MGAIIVTCIQPTSSHKAKTLTYGCATLLIISIPLRRCSTTANAWRVATRFISAPPNPIVYRLPCRAAADQVVKSLRKLQSSDADRLRMMSIAARAVSDFVGQMAELKT